MKKKEGTVPLKGDDFAGRVGELFGCGEGSEITRRPLQIISTLFYSAVEGIVITDSAGTIRMVNPAFSSITGYSSEEAVGRNPRILKSNRHPKEFYENFWKALINEGRWEGEIWNRRKNGEVYPEWLCCSAVYDENGAVTDYISVFNDLSEVHFKDAQIELRSNFDQLTGLASRTLFYSRLEAELKRQGRDGRRLALLVLDINRFKNINDSLGHFAGDGVLQQVGARLSRHLGGRERASRIGGDDFHILIPDARSVEEIASGAEKILSLLNDPVDAAGNSLFLSVSLGIAVFPDDGRTAEALLKKADIAMHKAKEFGISNYRFFTDELGEQASSMLLLENSMRRGLERSEFRLVYQPKYDLREDRVSGMEALLRWHAPDRVIPPWEFSPLAEETGLILPLGEWVFREVCRQVSRWTDEGYPPREVAVNFSARQLHQDGLVSVLKATMEEFSVPPSRIGIEITESGVMEDLVDSVAILSRFKDLGMTVYIDDFGTGYSSLNYLKRLPIDVLKIDKSFVDGFLADKNDAAITRAVIGLGRSLDMAVVAEGVETREQLDFLRQNGCDEIQGYLLSPPLPPRETLRFRKTGHTPLFSA